MTENEFVEYLKKSGYRKDLEGISGKKWWKSWRIHSNQFSPLAFFDVEIITKNTALFKFVDCNDKLLFPTKIVISFEYDIMYNDLRYINRIFMRMREHYEKTGELGINS